jgi:YidC/Oxa1 family membrane protein insertase
VVIYWLTTNVWTIGQQQLILRVVPPHSETPGGDPPDKPGKKAKATAGKPTDKPATTAPSKGAGDNGQRSPTRASKPHPSSKKKKR